MVFFLILSYIQSLSLRVLEKLDHRVLIENALDQSVNTANPLYYI